MGADVRVRGLDHSFRVDAGRLRVLKGLDLDVGAGDYVSLTGPSGAGKTTLLSILGGLEPPSAGEVVVGGQDVGKLAGDRLAAFRRTTVGFVFQHFGLMPSLTALENIELALSLSGEAPKARRERAINLLQAAGLAER